MKISVGSGELFFGCGNNRFHGDAEVLEEILGRARGTEGLHADEGTLRTDEVIPAFAHAGFDGNLDRRIADNRGLVGFRLVEEEFDAGDGNDARRDALAIKRRLGFQRQFDFEPDAKIVTLASAAETSS